MSASHGWCAVAAVRMPRGLGLARAMSHAHLVGGVVRARALRRQRRVPEQVVVYGGIGVRGGGERGALHDPIVLTIVPPRVIYKSRLMATCKGVVKKWIRFSVALSKRKRKRKKGRASPFIGTTPAREASRYQDDF